MNNFIDEIIGNDKVKLILSNILSNGNVPHAFLFTGPNGVGKESAAISFVKALNFSTTDPQRKIIDSITNFAEPYVKYIFPLPRGKSETDQSDPYEKLSEEDIEQITEELKEKSKNHFYKMIIPRANFIKISSIRDIKKFLSLNYEDVKYRVILFSQAHLMNEEAQNALLKSLEEPPKDVIFILCTSSPEKLRETIRSRCWNIHFQPLSDHDLLKILLHKFEIDESLATQVVPFANGSVENAIALLENNFEELLEKTIKILRFSFGRKYHSALNEFEEFLAESDVTKIKLIITLLIIWLNDFQKYRLNEDANIYFNMHIETLQKFKTKFPKIEISSVTNSIDKISSSLKNNININVAVSNIIFQLSTLTKQN